MTVAFPSDTSRGRAVGSRLGAGVRSQRGRLGAIVLVAGIGYLVLVPLFRLQQLAFENGAQGYKTAFGRPTIGSTLRATVGLALGSVVIALVLGTLLAWAATRLPPGLRVLRVLPILPIVVPAVAAVIGWTFLLSPRPGYLNALLRNLPWWNHLEEGPVDIYTLPWIVIITGFSLTAFVYLFVCAGFANLNSELIEAAQASGSSSAGAFFKVTLPLLRPTLVYGGGVALLLGLGQFTGPLLLGRTAGIRVLTTDMYFSVSQSPIDYAAAAAVGSPLLVFGLLVVVAQRLILGDQRRFVTHGGKAFRSNSRPSWLAVAVIVGYSFAATILPIIALIVVGLSPFWSADINVGEMGLQNFRQIFQESGITDAIINSITISLLAVAISIPIGFMVSRVILKGRRIGALRPVLDFLVTMPLGIPAVVFGVGFLFAYTQEPFFLYGTKWVIVLVYVTLMLPFTTRMQMAGMVSLGDTYVESSRTSGAGALRTNMQIVLPLLRPTIGGAAALMFVLLTHEFAASLLVRSPTMQVMGTVLFDYYGNGSYPLVAAVALVMTAVTAAGVTLAVLIGGGDVFDKL
jgi:iron(III) transport system permease protein